MWGCRGGVILSVVVGLWGWNSVGGLSMFMMWLVVEWVSGSWEGSVVRDDC